MTHGAISICTAKQNTHRTVVMLWPFVKEHVLQSLDFTVNLVTVPSVTLPVGVRAWIFPKKTVISVGKLGVDASLSTLRMTSTPPAFLEAQPFALLHVMVIDVSTKAA